MITRSAADRQPAAWQIALARAVSDPIELLKILDLEPGQFTLRLATRDFPLRVPRAYIARMHCGNPHDPLLRQVLPLADEDLPSPGFGIDPVGDLAARAGPGILHKYHGRALVITTGACAIHCRYCFRRHFPYNEAQERAADWASVLDYLARDTRIEEVILSGGDPLALSDQRLALLVQGLDRIKHLQRLRIHTRLPIVLPERVDAQLLGWLTATRLKPVMVVHANHAQELDAAVEAALDRLRRHGVHLLNQSVLLRGVNDSVPALQILSERLFNAGVLPYYLHLLDPVQGAAHFDVPALEAQTLVRELATRLPGYLLPRLVREQAGAAAKQLVSLC
ncbi:MAG: EF-P beta-lysylation protein EpmB [Gammaproteobacteria bacterium]